VVTETLLLESKLWKGSQTMLVLKWAGLQS
jgi:hypothetical protein